MRERPDQPVSSAAEDENDTLCALVTKPILTPYQRLEAVIAIYGITISLGCFIFVIFGTVDLKAPTRETFHDTINGKLSWVPNALYIYVFALVAYMGLLGFMYYCFGPRQKKGKQSKTGDGCPCCPNVVKGGEKSIIAFIVLGLTFQVGVGAFVFTNTALIYNDPVAVENLAKDGFRAAIVKYCTKEDGSHRVASSIDEIQKEHKCCGSLSPDDWTDNERHTDSVPDSCRVSSEYPNRTNTELCQQEFEHGEIYKIGCWTFIVPKVEGYLRGAILVSAIVVGLEMTVIAAFWVYLSYKWCGNRSIPSDTLEGGVPLAGAGYRGNSGGATSNVNTIGHTALITGVEEDKERNYQKPRNKHKHRDDIEA